MLEVYTLRTDFLANETTFDIISCEESLDFVLVELDSLFDSCTLNFLADEETHGL